MTTKMESIEALKVKRRTLAEESRIIRNAENRIARKAKKGRLRLEQQKLEMLEGTRRSLFDHRKYVVRPEARAGNIAVAFLKGHEYIDVEQKTFWDNYIDQKSRGLSYDVGYDNLWNNVVRIVSRFGFMTENEARSRVLAWRDKTATKPVWTTKKNRVRPSNQACKETSLQ